ncbi:MAG: F0F1 ATP synthase subunit B [Planctomycetota bacterium]|jgi:F-type H+-transporting ATPase subunit b|nr:F0F1 ATP synthase subunit B [Planctomycetota bacterium]MSR37307.1 ATP synthase F0 subunit B [Planctomycetota bacterium]
MPVLAVTNHLLALATEGQDKDLGALLEFIPGATLWTWIAFFVALPVMWKMIYGPITKALEERDRKVEDAIVAAEAARKEAEHRMAEAKAELDKARAESRRMVEEAVARAERQASEAQQKAEERLKAQQVKANAEIEATKRAALQEIRNFAVELTMTATRKILQQDVNDEAHRKMVRDFVGATGSTERR